ncbi:carbamoylphosphate synthase large subunit [Aneurinibacillus soli]|uniref:Uncharacterized protein n=1 Tax=Aneurinibacillus soli TaxID=1500254 RepID=A0A0U5BHT7_9BACL|nr:ATP-grasp domain-containing protein [Aneurinibacillus soli]PYE63343.1 carbamoylphosphate synthase large subunit [Aneurinibacillus soli]BAU27726.1 hypothetical protein CB4_01900 [Aneurinibacillus soli]
MSTSRTVLLTGGRAPATLELARILHLAGHRVLMAESFRAHLSRRSRSIARSYDVPSPRYETEAYIERLSDIIRQENVDMLVPTCEETFYIALHREKLALYCEVFTADKNTLLELHDKYAFIQKAARHGFRTPRTHLVESPSALEMLQKEWNSTQSLIAKPVYSRFSARVRVCEEPSELLALSEEVSPSVPWVVQEYIPGVQMCTYTVAHKGRVVLHAAYRSVYTAGRGATIYFRPAFVPELAGQVERFVQETGFHGQLAFDFIEEEGSGEFVVLECNPRLTSGIHLFSGCPEVACAWLGLTDQVLVPHADAAAMLGLAMVLYGLPRVRSHSQWRAWRAAVAEAQDVIWRADDPRPFGQQFVSYAALAVRAWRLGTSMMAASTDDIEWSVRP